MKRLNLREVVKPIKFILYEEVELGIHTQVCDSRAYHLAH